MTAKRWVLRCGIAVVGVLVLAACGGGSRSADAHPGSSTTVASTATVGAAPRTRLLAALQTTTSAKTARLALSVKVSVSGAGAGASVSETGTGVLDLSGRKMSMTLAEHDPSRVVTTQIRVVDDMAYVNVGQGWSSVAVGSTSALTPAPNSYLDYLHGVSDDVRVQGTEVVRGAHTTRFGATIDLARALAEAPGAAAHADLGRAVAVLGKLKIPTQVWIDDQGRMRKMRLLLGVGAGPKVSLDETVELYDFGVPVDVVAPTVVRPTTTTTLGARDRAAADRATEIDLRDALTAEKVKYTDDQSYTDDTALLTTIEPSLSWGVKVKVFLGGSGAGAGSVVCLSETSRSGTVFAVADAATGPMAGTYFARHGCPAKPTAQSVAALDSSW